MNFVCVDCITSDATGNPVILIFWQFEENCPKTRGFAVNNTVHVLIL
jgi:hypothetical protein